MAEGVKDVIWGTGRRKTAIARVRIKPGTGIIVVNGRPFDTYFPVEQQRHNVTAPLVAAQALEKWDVWAKVGGGGPVGQSGAMSLGIARALRLAVRRMLPKTKLGRAMFSKLKVYAGPDHPHSAQKPVDADTAPYKTTRKSTKPTRTTKER